MSSVLVEQRSKFDPYKNPEKGFRTLDSLDQIDFRSLHSSRITTFNEQNKKNARPSHRMWRTWKLDLLIVTTYVTHHTIKRLEIEEEKLSRMANKSDSVWVFVRLFGFILTSFRAKRHYNGYDTLFRRKTLEISRRRAPNTLSLSRRYQ